MNTISVIIPTYNRSASLVRALDSVLAQQHKAQEIVVVDDGSSDSTQELSVWQDYAGVVTYLRSEFNRGVSWARNWGVAHSRGDWLAFLDSDDQWHPAKLKEQLQWLGTHPDWRIVQTHEIWIRNGVRVNPPDTHRKVEGEQFARNLERCMITPSSVMVQRSLFDECGGFDESLPTCEDYDLWLKITSRYPVGLVDKYLLTRYGGHADQLSAAYPVMDRYRIESLHRLLQQAQLSSAQQSLVRKTLAKKASIVANGARKRGNEDEFNYYNTLARSCEDGSGEPQPSR
jgi:glycosyltransferase involved in cell wall biosynthesis